jgi:hypothetical protein
MRFLLLTILTASAHIHFAISDPNLVMRSAWCSESVNSFIIVKLCEGVHAVTLHGILKMANMSTRSFTKLLIDFSIENSTFSIGSSRSGEIAIFFVLDFRDFLTKNKEKYNESNAIGINITHNFDLVERMKAAIDKVWFFSSPATRSNKRLLPRLFEHI